jgi:hypothetical protein
LFNGRFTGKLVVGLRRGSKGSYTPEYQTVVAHFQVRKKRNSYRRMKFFDEWNPNKGGAFVNGMIWLLKNLPKPGPGWQLHVLKTKKHPHGFFGPSGIVWRHKMDRHDQDLLDLIHEWPKKKLREFVQKEIQPLLKAA